MGTKPKSKKKGKPFGSKEVKHLNQGQSIGKINKDIRCSYKELKIKAVALGMPFPDVVESDTHGLTSYIRNANTKPDLSLLDKFDDWVDKQLELRGYPPGIAMRNPILRLGFIQEKDDEGEPSKTKRVKGLVKPKKEKRERDEKGLYKGTKKSYTYELASKGFDIERTKRRVLKKFPDASEKSITIWYRAALRKEKDEKGK